MMPEENKNTQTAPTEYSLQRTASTQRAAPNPEAFDSTSDIPGWMRVFRPAAHPYVFSLLIFLVLLGLLGTFLAVTHSPAPDSDSGPGSGSLAPEDYSQLENEEVTVTRDKTLRVTGTTLIDADLTVTGTTTLDGPLTLGTQATLPTHAVRADRTITAGDGLIGGGNLTADRTISVDYGSLPGTAVQGDTTITVDAGSGLSGGGTLTLGEGGTINTRIATTPVTPGTYGSSTQIPEFTVTDQGRLIEAGSTTVDIRALGAFVQGGNSFGELAVLGTNDDQALAIETGGSERLRVTTTGNVGIGTDTPANTLDVNGGIDADTLNTGQGDNELYRMDQDVRTGDSPAFSGLSINGTLSANGAAVLGNTADDPLTFNGTVQGSTPFLFEGATDDANQLALAVEDPTADVTYRFLDPAGGTGTYDICTTDGNCTGASGGSAPHDAEYVTLSLDADLTAERVLTAGTNISITDGGADGNVTVNVVDNPAIAGDLTVNGATSLTSLTTSADTTLGDGLSDQLTVNATLQGSSPLRFEGATANTNETTFAITDPTADRTITFPDTSGEVSLLGQIIENSELANNSLTVTAGNGLSGGGSVILGGSTTLTAVLGTDIDSSELVDGTIQEVDFSVTNTPTDEYVLTYDATSGGFTWVDPSTQDSAGVDSLNTLTGDLTLQGTADQISIADNGADTLTLSTPQDIATTSSPTFGGLTVNGTLSANGSTTLGDAADDQLTVNATLQGGSPLRFEGATANTNETTFAITDPTADRTVTFPDLGGEVSLLGQIIENSELANDNVTYTAGTGLTGGGTVTLGGSAALDIATGNGIQIASDAVALGPLTGDWNQTGSFDIVLNNSSSELRMLESGSSPEFFGTLDIADLTADRTYNFPDLAASSDEVCIKNLENCIGDGSGGGAAPADATYVTLSLDADLSNERALDTGASLSLSDGGANANVTLNTVQNIQTTASPTFSNLTLQGGTATLGEAGTQGQLVFHDGGGTDNTGTLQVVSSLAQDTVYTIPDPSAASDEVCLVGLGNCAGSGDGVTTSGGTADRIAKFTSGQNIEDSSLIDDGATVSIDAGVDLTVDSTSLHVDATGDRVGIGTATPSQLLHVAGNALIDNDLTVSGSGSFTGTVSGADAVNNDEFVTLGQINDGSDTSTTAFVQGGNSFGTLATLGTNDANDLAFETGGTEHLRVDTSGNLGIGTTNPGNKLHIVESADASAFVVEATGISNKPAFSLQGLPSGTKAFELKQSGESFGRAMFYSDGAYGIGPGSATRDVFLTRDSANTFRIGNSPSGAGAADLLVNRTLNVDVTENNSGGSAGVLRFGATNSGEYIRSARSGTTNVDGLDLVTSNATRLSVTTGGDIGIGTASPGYALDVQDGTGIVANFSGRVIGGDAVNNDEFVTLGQVNDGSSTNAFVQGGNSFGALAMLGTNDANDLAFETGGTEKVRIDTNGNVGIGTTSPGELLTLNSGTTSATDGIYIQDPSNISYGARFMFDDTNSLAILGTRSNGTDIDAIAIKRDSGNVGIGTNTPNNELTVGGNADIAGNLGINTATPSVALDVVGSGAFTSTVSGADAVNNDEFVTLGQINDGSDTSTTAFVQGGNSFGTLATLGTNDANDLAFETGGAEHMRIDTAGNIAIGQTNPSRDLHLSRGGSAFMAITSGDSKHAGILFGDTTSETQGGVVYDNSIDSLGLRTGGNNTRLTITSGGNVGIGTAGPDNKLHVQGGATIDNELQLNGNATTYHNVATRNTNGNPETGTMKIDMPKSWSSTMMQVRVHGYNYTSNTGAWEVVVGGYNYNGGNWARTSAEVRGRAPFSKVRLAHDGDTNVLLLGDTNTDWHYPRIVVEEFVAGHSNQSGWGTGWSISNITDESNIASVDNLGLDTYIDTSGRFGINTTTPDNTLDVQGGIDANTLNTGHGDNELYAMNQNVRTTDSPTFAGLTSNSVMSQNGNDVCDVGGNCGTITYNGLKLTTGHTGDINVGTPAAVPWDNQLRNDSNYSHSTSTNPSRVTFDRDGTYRVYVNLAFDSGSARVNPRIRIRKNGNTYLTGEGLSGYIRAASGHDEASNSLQIVEDFQAGDYIEIMTDQIGNSGTVTLRPDQSLLIVEGSETLNTTDADTLDGYDSSEFAVLAENNTFTGNQNVFQSSTNSTTAFQVQDSAGTSILNVDTTNQRLGIGTTTPNYALDIQDGTGIVGQFSGRVIGGDAVNNNEFVTLGQVSSGSTSTDAFLQGGNSFGTLATLGTNDANNLAFETDGTERFRVDTIGNVGIGTTSPAELLHISKDQDAATQIRVSNQNTGTSSYAGLYLTGQGNNFWIKNWGDGTAKANITEFISTAGGSEFAFSPGNSEALRITTAGNVGIGDTTPSEKLQIGDDSVSSDSFVAVGSAGSNNAGIKFLRTGSTDSSIISDPNEDLVLNYMQSDLSGRDLLIKRGSAGTDVAIFDQAGNVGIGTTSPANTLDVQGGIDANTLNTGQGDNELYAMDQNVRTTDSPTFGGLTLNGNLSMSGNQIYGANFMDFENNEHGNFDTDGRLYWDKSAGLYIKSSNAPNPQTGGSLLWSSENFTASQGLSVSYAAEDEPTLSVNNLNTLEDGFNEGSIPFSNGSNLTEDNANLFWSQANNQLGIGTNSPSNKLDVQGTGRFTGALTLGTQATTTSHAVRADRSISSGTGLTGGGNLTSNRTISLDTAFTDGRYVNTTGINGETLADHRDMATFLHSSSDTRTFTDLAFHRRGSSSVAGPLIIETGIDGSANMFWIEFDIYEYAGSQGMHKVTVKGYNRDSASNIVNEAYTYDGPLSDPGIQLARDDNGNLVIVFEDSSYNFSYPYVHVRKAMVSHSTMSDNYGTGWNINYGTDPSTYPFLTTVTDNAQVTPWSQLTNHVNVDSGTGMTGGGALNSSRTLSFDTAWGDGRYYTQSTADSEFVTRSGDSMTGNLGMQGNILHMQDANGVQHNFEQASDGTSGMVLRTATNQNEIFQVRSSGQAVRFAVEHGAPELRGTLGGWGIGTTTPSYALDVSSGTGIVGQFSGRVIGGNAVNNNEFVTLGQLNDGSSTSAFVQGGNSFGALATLGTNDANDLAFETGGTERVRIDTSGKMGIGTTAPAELLHVAGAAQINGVTSSSQMTQIGTIPRVSSNGHIRGSMIFSRDGDLSYDAGTGLWEKGGGQTDMGGFFHSHNDGMNFFTIPDSSLSMNHSDFKDTYVRLSITNGGNVGIGTTSPSRSMSVQLNEDGVSDGYHLAAASGGAGSVWRMQLPGSSDTHQFGTVSSGALQFITNDLSRMTIAGDGDVGIGTGAPGTKLSVTDLTGTTSFNNLRYDTSTGDFYYYSSSERFKDDIQTWNQDPYQIMQAQPRSFIDKESGERNIGYIAEEFEEAGLEELIIYDGKGRPNGIEYQLISMYSLEILKDHEEKISDYKQRIEDLEASMGVQSDDNPYLQNGDSARFSDLNVSGETTLNTLTVTNDATFEGNVTVKELDVETDITVGGHIVSRGDQPDITVGEALTLDTSEYEDQNIPEEDWPEPAEATIEGTDTAGTIRVNTNGITIDANQNDEYELATIEFSQVYEALPRVVATAKNAESANVPIYIELTDKGFVLKTVKRLDTDSTYEFDYHVISSETVREGN